MKLPGAGGGKTGRYLTQLRAVVLQDEETPGKWLLNMCMD